MVLQMNVLPIKPQGCKIPYFVIIIFIAVFCAGYLCLSILSGDDLEDQSVKTRKPLSLVAKNLLNTRPALKDKHEMTAEILAKLKMDDKTFLTVYDYPIELLTKNEDKCTNKTSLDIVFLINAFIDNFDRRNAIRNTWGLENRTDSQIRHVFLMGIDSNNETVRQSALDENDIYGDIILGNFEDTYHNNSIKCIMGIDWARNYCSNSYFYIISDDDSYFNVRNLLSYLKEEVIDQDITSKYASMFPHTMFKDSSTPTTQKLRFFGGHLFSKPKPFRTGKYQVPESYYPYDVYVPFVNGHAMIMSNDVLGDIHEAAKHTKLLWLDDVYFGFLAAWAKIKLVNIPGIDIYYPKRPKTANFDDIISSHYVPTASELLRVWNDQKQRGKT